MVNSQMEFVLQNMQKSLEGQVEKVNKVQKDKGKCSKYINIYTVIQYKLYCTMKQ